MSQSGEMSDFARSLYSEQQGQVEEELPLRSNPASDAPSGMRRLRSRRRLSSRNLSSRSFSGSSRQLSSSTYSGSGGGDMAAAAAAVQRSVGEEASSIEEAGGVPLPPTATRQQSWFQDALVQGSHMDLDAILGAKGSATVGSVHTTSQEIVTDNDEVLEQYKIMAHLEASLRIKENIGFDMTEYEERRRIKDESSKNDYRSGKHKVKIALPPIRAVVGSADILPEEPPLPPQGVNQRFLNIRATPSVPELCNGTIARSQLDVPDGEHVVRCLGCKVFLRVNLMASLVKCPDCLTVSPACSTRR